MIGDYERLEAARKRAWKLSRLQEPDQQAARRAIYTAAMLRCEQYLLDVLARLPFRWHIEHAYTPRETALHGGGDHIVVDEDVRIGRIIRQPGDTLSRRRDRFWGLTRVNDGRLPTVLADIRIAERAVTKEGA